MIHQHWRSVEVGVTSDSDGSTILGTDTLIFLRSSLANMVLGEEIPMNTYTLVRLRKQDTLLSRPLPFAFCVKRKSIKVVLGDSPTGAPYPNVASTHTVDR